MPLEEDGAADECGGAICNASGSKNKPRPEAGRSPEGETVNKIQRTGAGALHATGPWRKKKEEGGKRGHGSGGD